jgi:hypothetical protein
MASRMFERKRRDRYRPLNEKQVRPLIEEPVARPLHDENIRTFIGERDTRPLREKVLDDSYPVYAGYAYVADGKVIVSDVSGTVKLLKNDTGTTEIKSCDLVGRNLF